MRPGSHLAVSSFFFLQLPKRRGWERQDDCEGSTCKIHPQNALGVGTRDGWPEPTEPETLASVDGFRLWLSASKKKGTTRRAHSLSCAHVQVHIHTHTQGTLMKKQYRTSPYPRLSLDRPELTMAPYRWTPVYRQEIGPDVLTKAS